MNSKKIKNSLTAAVAATLSAAALAGPLGAPTGASGAEIAGPQLADALGSEVQPEVLEDRARLQRGLRAAALRTRYDRVFEKADKLGVAPKAKVSEREVGPNRLQQALERLRDRLAAAQAEAGDAGPQAAGAPAAKVPSAASTGVSSGTLSSIAACESGGNPGAVSPSGTYRGKYQFDHATWASVGGSGDPAAAPEAEQDYRAGLLYSRAGSSPWPNCG